MRRSIILAICLLTVQPVWAASQAVGFATQAGAIAGFAQACGQDVNLFSSRAGEVIQAIATDNADATSAAQAFTQSRETQYTAQRSNNLVPCAQVLQDYATLPLLRDDYKDAVIARIKQTSTATVTPINQTPGGSVPPMTSSGVPTLVPPVDNTLPGNTGYTVPATPSNNVPNPQAPPPTSTTVGPVVMPPVNNPAGNP